MAPPAGGVPLRLCGAVQKPVALLLPVYDEFFVAYRDRSAAMPDRTRRPDTTFHQNPIFYPTVVVDGRLVSGWRRTSAGASIVATIGPPAAAAASRPAIAGAAAQYARFLDRPVSLVWETPGKARR